MMSVQDGLLWKRRRKRPSEAAKDRKEVWKRGQKLGNILDEFLQDVCDDFCRVGDFAPWLVEDVGVVGDIPGIPNQR